MIKPIQIALAPTRNRSLNMFLGIVLALVSMLLLLSISTYQPTDPSLNTSIDTVSPVVVGNWIGPFGAFLSDLLLQILGFTAFFIPVWMGMVAWGWIRSKWAGAAWLRGVGALLSVIFLPAALGLLPWHWRLMHAIPVEGVTGRLVGGFLVAYLNVQGAWIVAGVLALAGIYFALAINFRSIWENLESRLILLQSWHDRWRNWREDRADRRAEREEILDEQSQPGPAQRIFSGAIGNGAAEPTEHRVQAPSRLAAFFGRRNRSVEIDPVDEIPAFQRAAQQPAEAKIPVTESVRRRSIWENGEEVPVAPAASVAARTEMAPFPAVVPQPQAAVRPAPIQPRPEPAAAMPAPVAPRPEPVRAPLPPPPPSVPSAGGERDCNP